MKRLAVTLLALTTGVALFGCAKGGGIETGLGGGGGAGGAGGAGCVDPATSCPDPGAACVVATCAMGACATESAPAGAPCSDNGGKVCDGQGACVECASEADCPAPPSECVTATCAMGACGVTPVPDGTKTASGQTPGDCRAQVCDGAGATKVVDDDADPADDLNDCTADTCSAGAAVHTPIAGACLQGGVVCADPAGAKAGTCVECNTDADCTMPGEVCDPVNGSNTCVPADCADKTKNGSETDVDCGGTCAPCPNGKACVAAADCQSAFCDAMSCAACASDADCPADAYCDAGTCKSDEANGGACSTDAACQSGHCADGVCCDTACGGLCAACSSAKKGQGIDGVCGPIVAGNDPDDECAADAPATCQKNGACNGAGACQLYAAGTVCAPQSCALGVQSNADLCNGAGTCADGGGVGCGAYTCNAAGTACLTACASDAECALGDYCNGGACVTKNPNGSACSSNAQCSSGSCADGVCCDIACAGLCKACDVPGSVGTCANVPAGTDPAAECTGAQTCNGAGACSGSPNGTACSATGDCASGHCVDGVCCDTACSGTCQACNVAGYVGACASLAAGQDPAGECPGAYQCNGAGACQTCSDGLVDGSETDVDCGGGGACSPCADGKACVINGDCASNNCTGNVCKTASACSDGVVGAGEQCDDGNTTSGDGCNASCACEATQVVTADPSPNASIPDDGYDGSLGSMACVSIPLKAQCTISSVSVTAAITHSWIGDLVIKLVHPDGTVVTLMSQPGTSETADDGSTGGYGDDSSVSASYPITFQMGASTSSENMGTGFDLSTVCQDDGICTFAPSHGAAAAGDLTKFVGKKANGTWKLCVGDCNYFDSGAIDKVTLKVNQ